MNRTALLSADRRYRYKLERSWAPELGRICWVMLNPSTADAAVDDPTIRRCIRFTSDFGYGSMVVVNLFALRATDPAELLVADDPVGPENAHHVGEATEGSDLVVAAWGVFPERFRGLKKLVAICDHVGLQCLGQTKDGWPRHPLYVPASARPIPWKNEGTTNG